MDLFKEAKGIKYVVSECVCVCGAHQCFVKKVPDR